MGLNRRDLFKLAAAAPAVEAAAKTSPELSDQQPDRFAYFQEPAHDPSQDSPFASMIPARVSFILREHVEELEEALDGGGPHVIVHQKFPDGTRRQVRIEGRQAFAFSECWRV